MGKTFNMIVSNDFSFFCLIFILIFLLILLILFLKHKKTINIIDKEIKYTKVDDDKNIEKEKVELKEKEIKDENKEKINIQKKENEFNSFNIDNFVDDEDARLAIAKIMNEDVEEKKFFEENKINEDLEKIKLNEDVEEKKLNEDFEKSIFQKYKSYNYEIDDKNTEYDEIEKNKVEDVSKLTNTLKKLEEKNFDEEKTLRLEKLSSSLKIKENEIEDFKEKNVQDETIKPKENKQLQLFNDDEIKEEKKHSELEKVLEKMQQDLEEQKDKDCVSMFEQEQEERAIISYQELMAKKDELLAMVDDERFENEKTYNYDDNFSYDNFDLINNDELKLKNTNKNIDFDAVKEDNTNDEKKFVTTDFISPIFGRREATLDYPKVPNFKSVLKSEKSHEYDLEATMNLDPIAEKMQQEDAFLNALKEFRKNLE